MTSIGFAHFGGVGLKAAVQSLKEEIQELYTADSIPWVVGYSGGKDSTATLQLVWLALRELPVRKRTKDVYVISTDTLVENPIVAGWVTESLKIMEASANEQQLPIRPRRLTPEVTDTFWVNLIGRGYPAPRPKFRWCTERLKIKPSNTFIRNVVRAHGEAILVLGTRKAESSNRHARMTDLESKRGRAHLSPNQSLPNSLVYSPIENWSNDEVWLSLMQIDNPWGFTNKALLTMYQGASADGECPLVVDSTTPSCGDSRFGCWVCTLVDRDKSMSAMIRNDEEKEWMLPLLEIRNELDVADDRHLRDFRRMSGAVQLFNDRPIPGPYTQASRERWLGLVLEAQRFVLEEAPDEVSGVDLITLPELEEIRRIWVVDKHEFEDRLPFIYESAMRRPYPGEALDDQLPLGQRHVDVLRDITMEDDLHFQLVRELLDIEQRYRHMQRRAGLFDAIEHALRKGFFDDEQDATEHARAKRNARASTTTSGGTEVDLLSLFPGFIAATEPSTSS